MSIQEHAEAVAIWQELDLATFHRGNPAEVQPLLEVDLRARKTVGQTLRRHYEIMVWFPD